MIESLCPSRARQGAAALALLALGACSMFGSQPKFETMEGTISYEQPNLTSDDVSIVVDLTDLSADPGQVEVITQALLNRPKQPVHFSLTYDARNVVAGHRYGVSARLFDGQRAILGTANGKWTYLGSVPRSVDLILAPIDAKATH